VSALLVCFFKHSLLFGKRLFCIKLNSFVPSLKYNSYVGVFFLSNSEIYISWIIFQDLKNIMAVDSILEDNSK